jgi:hypothetical protein
MGKGREDPHAMKANRVYSRHHCATSLARVRGDTLPWRSNRVSPGASHGEKQQRERQ